MISKIKNIVKNFKAYNKEKHEQKERMQTAFPTRSIYIGSYQKPILHDGLKMDVKQEDAFLIDNVRYPKTAIRLTGDNPSYQIVPIEFWKTSLSDENNYLYIDDNGEVYMIQLSLIDHPDFNSKPYITLEDLISEMGTRNKTNLTIAKELAVQKSMGLTVEK